MIGSVVTSIYGYLVAFFFCFLISGNVWAETGVEDEILAQELDASSLENVMLPQEEATVHTEAKTLSLEEDKLDWEQFSNFIIGQPAANSLNLGMWSYHFYDGDDEYEATHNLIGVTYRGIAAGTFINSKNLRTWSLALQRDVYATTIGVLNIEMGYRLGLLYGYDNLQLFGTGLFPLIQLYADVRYKRVGVQFSWAGTALTAGFIVHF